MASPMVACALSSTGWADGAASTLRHCLPAGRSRTLTTCTQKKNRHGRTSRCTISTASKSLADIPRQQAKERGNSTAHASSRAARRRYAALDTHTSQVANGLIALGQKPQARIGYMGMNSDIFFEVLLGSAQGERRCSSASTGASPVPKSSTSSTTPAAR